MRIVDLALRRRVTIAMATVAVTLFGIVSLSRLKVNLLGSVTHLGEKPHLDQLIGVVKVMLDSYSAGTLDRVFRQRSVALAVY